MPPKSQTRKKVQDETAELKNRLAETEETLHAIRQYLVDAFVVTRANGEQVVTLNSADFPYRMMVESMNEGAVTLIPDGTIFYCNPRFCDLVEMDGEALIGVRFQDLITAEQQEAFGVIFNNAGRHGLRGEFCLRSANGACVPLQLSIYQLISDDGVSGIAIIATDITDRIQAEEKIRSLASKLTVAEQQERLRISQILHDDLQQRLFAIKAQMSLLKDEADNNSDMKALQLDLNQLQGWLSEAITITRNLSINISPVVLQGEGLTEAITWISSQMKEQYGLQVALDVKGRMEKLDEHMRVLLFQVVRELLFNVVKHSGTLEATVSLEPIDDCVAITVSDDGKGFDPEVVMNDSKAAHGLLILQDRLSLMGCKMEINSTPGVGTRIVVEAPLATSLP